MLLPASWDILFLLRGEAHQIQRKEKAEGKKCDDKKSQSIEFSSYQADSSNHAGCTFSDRAAFFCVLDVFSQSIENSHAFQVRGIEALRGIESACIT